MPGLLIKEFPEALHYKLKARAARNKRSMTKEALYLLEMALIEEEEERPRPMPAPVKGTILLTDKMINSAKQEGRP